MGLKMAKTTDNVLPQIGIRQIISFIMYHVQLRIPPKFLGPKVNYAGLFSYVFVENIHHLYMIVYYPGIEFYVR